MGRANGYFWRAAMVFFLTWSGLACGTPQALRKEDAGPKLPAFQYEQYVRNEGFRGKFASESRDLIKVTPDRKATDSSFKFTGAIMGRLMKEQRNLEIVRLDKDLVWQVNVNKSRYLELPIQKMALQVGIVKDDPNAETAYVEECCTVKTDIKRPGSKKMVNGYESEQVILTWTSVCPDEETGEPGKTTMTLEIWMAPGVKLGSELDSFNQAYARKLGFDMQMMNAVGEQFRQAFPGLKDLALMMKDLKGYPILSTLSVEDDRYLKKMQTAKKEETSSPSGASATALVTGFFEKKLKEREEAKQKEEAAKWGNVIWRVSWESRNFQKVQVSPSEFELLDGLKKVEQKEYLEGEQGKPVVEPKPARFVRTACLATLKTDQLGIPVYPGAKIARTRPYSEMDHNTKWYYKSKTDYRVQYSTADPMDKVVAFYEDKLKTKCVTTTVKDGGTEYKESVCRQPAGQGLVRMFRMSGKPLEMQIDVLGGLQAAEGEPQKKLGFELSVGKGN
ncbi:MAG: hypothetical protein HXY45_10070 [Syntrophaceae bacterium]|nr:hypothetical protein [Syntrophaceae bacterium]